MMRTANRYARPENFAHPVRTPLLRKHFVYRAFDANGDLLYVGCSMDVEARLKAHRMGSWHHLMTSLRVEGPYNYETARQIEWEAIESRTQRPQFNYTSDHRLIEKCRGRMIDREMAHRIALGQPHGMAASEAVDEIEFLFPFTKNVRLDDDSVATARRVEAAHADSLERAA